MFNPQDSLFKKFLKSPHHAWLAGLTLGLGVLSAHPLALMVGVGVYALGWVFLPDSSLFQKWIGQRETAISAAEVQRQVAAFAARRSALISKLSTADKAKYQDLVLVCQDIERATKDSAAGLAESDPRLRKLDELMWTYLRLLVMHDSLATFLETEREDGLPKEVESSKQEVAELESQIQQQAGVGNPPSGSKTRLLDSKKERLAVLTKRLERLGDARDNLALVAAEQARLVEQIKLLRADAITSRNAETLTARIDATVENLTTTNRIISEMDQFKDLVADDMPMTSTRLGFSSPEVLPPILADRTFQNRTAQRN